MHFSSYILIPFFMIITLLAPAILALRHLFKKSQATVEEVLYDLGFAYDPNQDIFYSTMNAWQRRFGYCQLYDEGAAPFSMIIDCEPVHFTYDGKKWLIELWKGQYGINCGAEIGVYTASGSDLDIPGYFNGTFYDESNVENHLEISFTLYKNGQELFRRKARHWWLTGFVLGEFSEPDDLVMEAKIIFKNEEMLHAFVIQLKKIGYTDKRLRTKGCAAYIHYSTPYAHQPLTRTAVTDAITQANNKALCNAFHKIVGNDGNAMEQLQYLQANDPAMFRQVIKSFGVKRRFKSYATLQKLNSQGGGRR